MSKLLIKSLCIAISIFTVQSVHAEELGKRSFLLENQGYLELQVPSAWDADVRRPPGGLPPTIIFMPQGNKSFLVQITVIYPIRDGMKMPDNTKVQSIVKNMSLRAKSQSIETDIPILKLEGKNSNGYYFTATSKGNESGEYKYIAQGMFRVGELAPTFTVLMTDKTKEIIDDVISIMQNANHIPSTL